MKKIITLIALLLCTLTALAQAPQKMSYQAVVRNSANALITSTDIGVKISVLQNGSNGSAVYTETQNASTNAN